MQNVTTNPFEQAKAKLIERLALVVCPKAYRVFPSPADHLNVAQHMRDVAEVIDDWFSFIGDEIAENAVTKVDRRCFEAVVTCAIDGNATYCAEREAEALSEGRAA